MNSGMKFILILLISGLLHGSDAPCTNAYCLELFTKYKIDRNIKTNAGWTRVCVNRKLQQYTSTQLSRLDTQNMCDCFELITHNNRAVESTSYKGEE